MNFQELLAKMQQLDQPVPEAQIIEPAEGNEFSGALAAAKAAGKDEFEVDGKKYKVKEDGTVEACGVPNMPTGNETPPSMSLNLNAQGMDDIADMLKLVAKVNPDMDKPNLPPLPSMGDMPSVASIKPAMPPLKMLPDLSDEPHNEPDGDEVPQIKGLDQDGDGDHDMKDHGMEKKDKEEAYGNSLGDSEPEIMGFKAAIPDGDDLNKPKKSYSDKPYRGDNPMSTESTDLRAQIRADLQRRLNEAKKS